MSSADTERAEAEPVVLDASASGVPRRVRVLVLGAWVAGSVLLIAQLGVPRDAGTVALWLMTGLAVGSIGRPDWFRPLVDWSPFVVFYIAYDHVRALSFLLDSPAMWQFPIQFDTALGLGTLPTVWLHQHLPVAASDVAWWEVPLGLVYVSHFYASVLVAAYFWVRDRSTFFCYLRRLMAVLGIGAVFFVLVPTAPPWAASQCPPAQVAADPASPRCLRHPARPRAETLIPRFGHDSPQSEPLVRRTARGFKALPGSSKLVTGSIRVGIRLANPMAAFPSLHAACAALIAVFLWPRVRARWRPLLVVYPLAMAFALVWSLDHYVFDIVAGWLLVALVCGLPLLWQRWRSPGQA